MTVARIRRCVTCGSPLTPAIDNTGLSADVVRLMTTVLQEYVSPVRAQGPDSLEVQRAETEQVIMAVVAMTQDWRWLADPLLASAQFDADTLHFWIDGREYAVLPGVVAPAEARANRALTVRREMCEQSRVTERVHV